MRRFFYLIFFTVFLLGIALATSELTLYCKGYRIDNQVKDKEKIAKDLQNLYDTAFWGPCPQEKPSYENPDVIETVWPSGQRKSRPLPNKKADKKILILGCSYTYGMGVKDSDTYPWLLNNRFSDVSFDNYGVCGYSTYQCCLLMEEVLKKHQYHQIIYACIADHPRRCVDFEVVHKKDGFVDVQRPLVEIINTDSKGQALAFRTRKDYLWPWQNNLLTVNFLKSIYLVTNYAMEKRGDINAKSHHVVDENLMVRAFVAVLNRMESVAKKNKAQFLKVALDPGAKSFITRNKIGKDSPKGRIFVLAQPNIFANDWLDASSPKVNMPQYHVNNRENGHPNKDIHKMWADKIADYLMYIDNIENIDKNNKENNNIEPSL